MKIRFVLTSLLWLFSLCASLVAQDKRPLNVRVKDSARVYQPAWLFISETPATYSEHCKCDMLNVEWAKGGSRLLAIVYAHESEEDAGTTYKSLMEWYAISGAKGADESYLWKLPGTYFAVEQPGRGFKMYAYFLRRGPGVVMVSGRSPDLVKSFASLIAAEFPAT